MKIRLSDAYKALKRMAGQGWPESMLRYEVEEATDELSAELAEFERLLAALEQHGDPSSPQACIEDLILFRIQCQNIASNFSNLAEQIRDLIKISPHPPASN